jgi:hypothetical protein
VKFSHANIETLSMCVANSSKRMDVTPPRPRFVQNIRYTRFTWLLGASIPFFKFYLKNVTVLPVVKARRAVTGKNDVLPD